METWCSSLTQRLKRKSLKSAEKVQTGSDISTTLYDLKKKLRYLSIYWITNKILTFTSSNGVKSTTFPKSSLLNLKVKNHSLSTSTQLITACSLAGFLMQLSISRCYLSSVLSASLLEQIPQHTYKYSSTSTSPAFRNVLK